MTTSPMYFLWSVALALGLILGLPYWLYQMLRHGKYRQGLGERLGCVPDRLRVGSNLPVIWVHAVSVGEVIAVTGLIEQLRAHSGRRIVVSTTTDTGQKLARQKFGPENVFYFPVDLPFAVQPYLALLRPEMMVIAETEFWPNTLRAGKRARAKIAVVNARISDKSLTGYIRFERLLSPVLNEIDLFLAQTAEDALRLKQIGAPEERIQVSGNLKFDAELPEPPEIAHTLKDQIAREGAGPVLVCGSTVEGEEPLLLGAYSNFLVAHPRSVMILAPRHPERFAEVAELLQRLSVAFIRRSLWNGESLAGKVLLLDSIGELTSLYGLADAAFVGGSLVARGGHNILEPARHGVPIIVGNHTENFRDIVGLFESRDAVRVVGPAELPLLLMHLFEKENEQERKGIGARAAETVRSQRGATARTLEALEHLLPARRGGASA
jgi:3-deoxy-D-manno-octulosonic-acid transferase